MTNFCLDDKYYVCILLEISRGCSKLESWLQPLLVEEAGNLGGQ
jgi:hypothetical protein